MKSTTGNDSIFPDPPKDNPARGSVGDMGSLPKGGESKALSSVKGK